MSIDSRRVPDRNEEYLLYQTLIGTWPVGLLSAEDYDVYLGRIKNYMVKAVREAKVNSSWISPNYMYEDAMSLFVDGIMGQEPGNHFIADFKEFQEITSSCGMYNSLSQTLLKITCPGVPDFYQGTELWDLSLVDPDNRRPVDYGRRMEAMADIKRRESEGPLRELARDLVYKKNDGRVKLFLIYRALESRKAARDLYEKGDYRPLQVMGLKEYHVCAFARRLCTTAALIAAPRFFTRLVESPDQLPLGQDVWKDTVIAIQPMEQGGLQNVFTEDIIETADYGGATGLLCSDLFHDFP